LNGPLRADGGADTATLAIIEIDKDLSCLLVSGNAEIRAEEATHLTGLAAP
jgi:hypothetical protein